MQEDVLALAGEGGLGQLREQGPARRFSSLRPARQGWSEEGGRLGTLPMLPQGVKAGRGLSHLPSDRKGDR